MTRRNVLQSAFAAAPVVLLADIPAADWPCGSSKPMKITRVKAIHLEKPLKERFWMANSPIGGYQPKASRLIVTVHTDAGISGQGEGSGGGASILRKGFADLVIGEDPFMVGKIWEKMFAVTYGREPSSRGWAQNEVIAAMAPIGAAIYDLMAKSAGLPVYKYLGGSRGDAGAQESIEDRLGHIDLGISGPKLCVDLVGKAAHIRTVPVPVPDWVKAAIDGWLTAASITEGRVFRCVHQKGYRLGPWHHRKGDLARGEELGGERRHSQAVAP